MKNLLILVLISILLTFTLHAGSKTFGSVVITEVISVYDGDTFRVNIDNWPGIVGQRISIRVNGVDTPEMRGKCQAEKEQARTAKDFTKQFLKSAKTVELRHIRRGKYFRIVADVYVDGRNLADVLIDLGLGVKYDGGKRESWCN